MNGRVAHIVVGHGEVIVVPAWMLDRAVCEALSLGSPRVTVDALTDLHNLLIDRGFRHGLAGGSNGAVLCLEASRLSRNGPDWHRLLELCGQVDARVIDIDGIYDPAKPNDRLLLGMKGNISEFELSVIRARMYEAARQKAQRGELRISVPIGYIWHRDYGLGFDPDIRVQVCGCLRVRQNREADRDRRWPRSQELRAP